MTRDGNPAQKLDIEGIATDGKGGFWLASEGRTDRLTPHASSLRSFTNKTRAKASCKAGRGCAEASVIAKAFAVGR